MKQFDSQDLAEVSWLFVVLCFLVVAHCAGTPNNNGASDDALNSDMVYQ